MSRDNSPVLLSLIRKNQQDTYALARAIDLVCDVVNDHASDIALASANAEQALSVKPKVSIERVIEYKDPPELPEVVSVGSVDLVDGELLVYLTDGTELNCGAVVDEGLARRINDIEASLKKRVVGGGGGNAKIVKDELQAIIDSLDENDIAPLSSTLTYNANGTLATLTKGGVLNTFSYDGDGNLSTIVNPSTTKTFTYDSEGILQSIAVT